MEASCHDGAFASHWTTNSCLNPSPDSGVGAVLFLNLISILQQSRNQLGNSADYPAPSNLFSEYDFIVIGSGSAGAVVASRLSEVDHWKVLLLEAGGDPSLECDVPILAPTLSGGDLDWGFKTEPQDGCCVGLVNQQCKWPRGKVLGGTSNINYLAYVRGMKADYDDWANAGNTGWSFKEVLRYFKKSEDLMLDSLLDKEYSKGNPYHSKGGELRVSRLKELYDIDGTILEAAKELGFEHLDDINLDKEIGFFQFIMTAGNGVRSSTARAFLSPAKNRKNLHVSRFSHVTKILIDKDTKQAQGVEFRTKNGEIHKIKAVKEVILSAGAVNSPQILMLSGVGPEDHLKEMGINSIKNLKVGENLQDHFMFPALMYGVEINSLIDKSSPNFMLDATYQYLMNHTGYFQSHPVLTVSGFVNTKSESKEGRPNFQLHFTNIPAKDFGAVKGLMNVIGFTENTGNSLKHLVEETDILIIFPTLSRPKSRGWILLRSSDPFDHPKIYPAYLSDPKGEDIQTMIEGTQLIKKLMKTKAMEKKGAKLLKLYVEACDELEFDSEEYWICIMKQIGTTLYHPSGSCKMGPSSDPTAVVDPELKVHGVKGIRIADASIMPTIVTGNTNAPVIMIAEKAADLLKQEWL